MIVQCPQCRTRHDSLLYKDQQEIQCRCGIPFQIPKSRNLATAWQCPNCAGTTSPDKNQCEFCGVYLAFSRCPSCFDPVFDGAKFCHACGEGLLQPAIAETGVKTTFDCPRCNDKLKAELTGEHFIHHCQSCGGAWLNHSVLQKVLEKKGRDKSIQYWLGKKAGVARPDNRHPVAYLPCPECEQLMHRRNFAGKSGVIMDECSAHGIWFDRNELASAIQFSQSSKHINFSNPTDLNRERERSSRKGSLHPTVTETSTPMQILESIIQQVF